MTNIYDIANELERALRQDEAYKNVENAFEQVAANEASYELYKEFIKKQDAFVKLMQSGAQPSEDEMAQFQELQTKLVADENVSLLISAQQRLQILVEDLNKIIYKPLGDLFNKYEK